MSKLKSPKQLDQGVIVHVPKEKMWAIFNDLSLRPKWTCDVQKIDYLNKMTTVAETATTHCLVNGKKGTIMTRCLALNPTERGEFLVENDTFGITKMLENMGFATEFKSIDENTTEVRMHSHYNPRNFILKMMNGFIKKKMGKEVDLMLEGLKNYSESGQVNLLNPVNQF